MSEMFYEGGAPSFSAICTMYNVPFKKDLKEVDFAIEGFPFEAGSVNRAETRYAPGAIRNDVSFKGSLGYSEVLDVDADEYLSGTDLGEAPILFGYKEPSLRIMQEESKKIVDADTMLIGLGGGQLVTLAELRAMKEKYGPVALIHFAAERSCLDKEEKYDDSTVVIRAVEEGLIDPAASIQLGIRGGYESKEECEFAKDLGMKVLTASAMYEMTEEAVLEEIKKAVGDKPAFVSLDMNFLDPVYAPGVENPVVGGFSTHYLAKLLRGIGMEHTVKGIDVVNVTLAYDTGKVTAQASSSLIKSFLFGVAKKKQNGGTL